MIRFVEAALLKGHNDDRIHERIAPALHVNKLSHKQMQSHAPLCVDRYATAGVLSSLARWPGTH